MGLSEVVQGHLEVPPRFSGFEPLWVQGALPDNGVGGRNANHWQTPEEAHSARPQGRGEAQSMLSWLVFGENPGPLLENTTHTSALERIAAWGDLAAGRLGRGGDASPARGSREQAAGG